jgi:cyanate permease
MAIESKTGNLANEPSEAERHNWGMLALSWLLYFSFAFTLASLFPIVGTVRAELGLSYAEVGVILGSWQLIYLVAAIPVGMLVDRFQPKLVLFVGTLIVALSQLGRSMAESFWGLFLAVALLGLGGPVMSVGLPKVIAEWFTGKPRALASGIYMTGANVGQMSALALTAFLTISLDGSWRVTLRIFAAMVIVNAFLWLIFAKPSRRAVGGGPRSNVMRDMQHVVKVPGLWLIVIVGFSGFLAGHGYRAWLPEMLTSKGISVTQAGLVAAVPAFFGIIGSIVIVGVLSPRSYKATVIAMLITIGCAILVAAAATGPVLLVAVAVEGFCAAALVPTLMNQLMEMPQIGPRFMGAAAGLYFTVGEMGGFIGPSIIGVMLSITGSFSAGILVLSLTMWAMVLPASRLPERTKS